MPGWPEALLLSKHKLLLLHFTGLYFAIAGAWRGTVYTPHSCCGGRRTPARWMQLPRHADGILLCFQRTLAAILRRLSSWFHSINKGQQGI